MRCKWKKPVLKVKELFCLKNFFAFSFNSYLIHILRLVYPWVISRKHMLDFGVECYLIIEKFQEYGLIRPGFENTELMYSKWVTLVLLLFLLAVEYSSYTYLRLFKIFEKYKVQLVLRILLSNMTPYRVYVNW